MNIMLEIFTSLIQLNWAQYLAIIMIFTSLKSQYRKQTPPVSIFDIL